MAQDVTDLNMKRPIGMRKCGVLAMALLMTSLAVASQGSSKNFDASAKLKYDSNGVQVEVLCVCEVTPTQVTAWDGDGNPAPQYVRQVQSLVMGSNDVSFRFGQKNRYVLVRTSSTSGSFANSSGNYVQTINSGYVMGRPSTSLVRLTGEPTDSTSELIATVQLPPSAPIDIPFSVGQHWAGDGLEAEVDSVLRVKGLATSAPTYYDNNFYGRPNAAKTPKSKYGWRIVMTFKMGADVQPYFGLTPLDEKKEPIRYVDADGNPVSSGKYLSSQKPVTEPNPYGSQVSDKYMPARFERNGPSDQIAFSFVSNVDPQKIKFLRATFTRQLRVQITGIPLDPK